MKDMMFSRKAEISGMMIIYYVVVLVFVGIAIALLMGLFNFFIKAGFIVSQDLETNLILERALSSPQCFAYQDEVGRTYFNQVDLRKFNNETVTDCFVLSGDYPYEFNFRLTYYTKDQAKEAEAAKAKTGDAASSSPVQGASAAAQALKENQFNASTRYWFNALYDRSVELNVLVVDGKERHLGTLDVQIQKTQRKYFSTSSEKPKSAYLSDDDKSGAETRQ